MSKSRKKRRNNKKKNEEKKKKKAQAIAKPAPPPEQAATRLLPRDPIAIDEGLAWYGVEVAPGRDRAVAELLDKRKVPHYAPSDKYERRYRDTWRPYSRSTFPGYLFVGFEGLSKREIPVLGPIARVTPGMLGPVMCDGVPVRIPGSILAEIEGRLIDAQAGRKSLTYAEGQPVLINAGPFFGHQGIVSRVHGSAVLDVLLLMFGRSTSVRLSVVDVEVL